MGPLLAMLCGIMQPVVMYRTSQYIVTTGDIIDGVTPNTEYAFQVAAVNVNGTGPFSEPFTLEGKW